VNESDQSTSAASAGVGAKRQRFAEPTPSPTAAQEDAAALLILETLEDMTPPVSILIVYLFQSTQMNVILFFDYFVGCSSSSFYLPALHFLRRIRTKSLYRHLQRPLSRFVLSSFA
jgi:hypothetical protein